MTPQEARLLTRGNVVRWNDPAGEDDPEGDCSKMDMIDFVDVQGDEDEAFEDDIVSIRWSDGSELECFANELTMIAN